MVYDPLYTPCGFIGSLAPALLRLNELIFVDRAATLSYLRIAVKSSEIQGRDCQIRHEINPDTRSVWISGWVRFLEPPFITDSDQMIRINGFDVSAHRRGPCSNSAASRITIRCRATRRSSTSGFVSKLPSHDRGLIPVSSNKFANVVLVRSNNRLVDIESIVRSSGIKLRNVDIHSTEIGPVVR